MTPTLPVEVVLQALETHGSTVTRKGDGAIATCPACKGSETSLSVGEPGKTLFYCRAGCSRSAVLRELGLTYADLAPAGPPMPVAGPCGAPAGTAATAPRKSRSPVAATPVVADDDQHEWPDLIPMRSITNFPTFPVEVLPKWVADYCDAIAVDLQVAVDLPAMVALAALGTIAGNRVRVVGRWTMSCNVYIVVCLETGEGKSPAFKRLMAPVVSMEKALKDEKAEDITRAKAELALAEDRYKDAHNEARRAQASGRKCELDNGALEAALEVDSMTIPVEPQLSTGDVTPEKLEMLMADQGGSMAVLSSEGSIFDQMAGRYSDKMNLTVYLEGYSGGDIKVDRVGRPPVSVPNPALTVGVTVQPDVLRMAGQNVSLKNRGMFARFLYAVPISLKGRRNHRSAKVAEELARRYDHEMTKLGMDIVRRDPADPILLRLSPEAEEMVTDKRQELEGLLGEGEELEVIPAWVQKVPNHMMKLAGLLHTAHGGTDHEPVSGETMGFALRIIEWATAHAVAVLDQFDHSEDIEMAERVLRWLERKKLTRFNRRECWLTVRRRGDGSKVTDVDGALDLLVDHGYIRPEEGVERVPAGWRCQPETKGGRPPSPGFEVSPHVVP